MRDPITYWKSPAYAPTVRSPLTPAVLADVEHEVGVRLPDALVELLREQNGGYLRDGGLLRSAAGIKENEPWFRDAEILEREYWQQAGNLDLLIPIRDGGHTDVCLDYRDCGPTGEPSVTFVDNECDSQRVLAGSFSDYLAALEFGFDDAVYLVAGLDVVEVAEHVAVLVDGEVSVASDRGPVVNVTDQPPLCFVENECDSGFGDGRQALRVPEYPECGWLLTRHDGLDAEYFEAHAMIQQSLASMEWLCSRAPDAFAEKNGPEISLAEFRSLAMESRTPLTAESFPQAETFSKLQCLKGGPSEEILLVAIEAPEPEIRAGAVCSPSVTVAIVERASRDSDEDVRIFAARSKVSTPAVAALLLGDSNDFIASAALGGGGSTVELARRGMEHSAPGVRASALGVSGIDQAMAEQGWADEDLSVRRAAVESNGATTEMAKEALDSRETYLQARALRGAGATEEMAMRYITADDYTVASAAATGFGATEKVQLAAMETAERNVRKAVAMTSEYESVLLQALNDESWGVREAAARSEHATDDVRIRASEDSDARVSRWSE